MSKPRGSTSKEPKLRDSKVRFIKTIEKIPPDLFGGKNTSPTDPTKIYISNTSKEGQSSTAERTQFTANKQSEITTEQLLSSPQFSGPAIKQFNLSEETTSFSEIQKERTIIPVERERIPASTYPFKNKENPLQKPSYTETTFIVNPCSLFGNMANEEEVPRVENQDRPEDGEQTFGFTILDLAQNTNMKNINPSILPTFHGMSTEDPDAFLFEFDILCRSYNYINDAKKLKLFPATLEDAALRWFMGLGEYSIRSWEQMKNCFLKKYQDYCRSRDAKNDIFKM